MSEEGSLNWWAKWLRGGFSKEYYAATFATLFGGFFLATVLAMFNLNPFLRKDYIVVPKDPTKQREQGYLLITPAANRSAAPSER